MNILYAFADDPSNYNSANWRMELPMRAINKTTQHAAKMIQIDLLTTNPRGELVQWADLIIIQRNLFSFILQLALEWQAIGKRVAVDCDDSYKHIPPSLITANFWKGGRLVPRIGTGNVSRSIGFDEQGRTKTDKTVDVSTVGDNAGYNPIEHLTIGIKYTGLITPSRMIAKDWQAYTDRVYYVPNYPEVDLYLNARRKDEHKHEGEIWIGWAGGGSHLESWKDSGVMTAVTRVLEKRRNVVLVTLGPKDVYDIQRTRNKRWIPWVDYRSYPDNLAALDIAFAPLSGNGYDRRRSHIKGLEYTLMGIPWLASDLGGSDPQPYDDYPRYHLVKNTAREWENALLDVIDNRFEYAARIDEEQAGAVQWDINKHVEEIIAVYERI